MLPCQVFFFTCAWLGRWADPTDYKGHVFFAAETLGQLRLMLLPKDDDRKKHLLGKREACQYAVVFPATTEVFRTTCDTNLTKSSWRHDFPSIHGKESAWTKAYVEKKLEKCTQLKKRDGSEQVAVPFSVLWKMSILMWWEAPHGM